MDCVFCKIVAGELPTEKTFENDAVVAFRDIHPKAPVHILIVPRRHIQSVAHLMDSDRSVMGELVFAAREIARDQNLTGYKLEMNVGRDGGQVIDHLHLHLLGGFASSEETMKIHN